MSVSSQNIHKTFEYRAAAEIVRLLPTGLFLIFCSLILFILDDLNRKPEPGLFWTVLCLTVGSAIVAIALWTRFRPGRPLYTLSPRGILYRIPWCKTFLVPWRQVQGVETIDVETRIPFLIWLFASSPTSSYYRTMVFRNVTAVLVSKQFYDSQILVDSYVLRGPGWRANFIPKGHLVQIALHHELVSVEPQSLDQAVKARWQAFGNQAAVELPQTGQPSARTAYAPFSETANTTPESGGPNSNVVAMGDNPRAVSTWEATKIIVPLIGIAAALANIVGLWQLPDQSKDREVTYQARAKAQENRKNQIESANRMREETKMRDAEQKELRKSFDDTMTRTFGR